MFNFSMITIVVTCMMRFLAVRTVSYFRQPRREYPKIVLLMFA